MVSFSALLSVAATITGTVRAHSWVHCSDYRGDRSYYEPEHCHGHPRPDGSKIPAMTAFGVDIGFNEQPQTSCHVGAADPLPGYPMARYKQGTEITLAWPSKNHVAATCTNPYIPDTSLELFVAEEDEDGHPQDFVQVPASFSDEPHENGTIDFKGFQNCPAFCENMDKALCTGTFRVPENLTDGVYTFQWKWVFNGGTDAYITCFEAYVGQDVAPVPAPTPAPTREGQTPAPTVEVPQDNCTAGMWAQCSDSVCCAGGVTCQRQSQYYSQCRPDCPSGWECDASTPEPTPQPTDAPAPTVDPTPSPTSSPTPSPTPTPCLANSVDVCPSGFGAEGKLIKPSGISASSATVSDACQCAHFCRLFNPVGSTPAWQFKESTGKCACYQEAKRVKFKAGGGVWVGMGADLATASTL